MWPFSLGDISVWVTFQFWWHFSLGDISVWVTFSLGDISVWVTFQFWWHFSFGYIERSPIQPKVTQRWPKGHPKSKGSLAYMFVGSLAQCEGESIINVSVHLFVMCVAPKCCPSGQLMWPAPIGLLAHAPTCYWLRVNQVSRCSLLPITTRVE